MSSASTPAGEVIGIFITASGGAPLHAVEAVRAVAGQGLEGDRYFAHTGSFSKKKAGRADLQATLIESEAIEALEREYGVRIAPHETRRNILTRGVALNHFVNREFCVGPVRMRGIKLCEPCGHLEKLTQKGVKKGLIHRGGLRAQILSDGDIEIGDSVRAGGE